MAGGFLRRSRRETSSNTRGSGVDETGAADEPAPGGAASATVVERQPRAEVSCAAGAPLSAPVDLFDQDASATHSREDASRRSRVAEKRRSGRNAPVVDSGYRWQA
jgi:hypothetical protein